MKVQLMPGGALISITGPTWSELFEVDDLPAKLRFYRRLAERGGKAKGQSGPYARHYADTVRGLEAVARQVTA